MRKDGEREVKEIFSKENETYTVSPIAHIRTGFPSKFGIPRQSGLVHELCGKIIFEKTYSSEDWTRGLEGFSHIWALWVFSETVGEKIGATVRPPKLGGNKRMGVFATRSPYRPNYIGMSCLKIERIERNTPDGTVIYVKGADMLDNTPILDIKPYLPFADSYPDANGGFACCDNAETESKVGKKLTVQLPSDLAELFPTEHIDELLGILSEDPRPSYIQNSERVYSFEFYNRKIRFSVDNDVLTVTEILPVD